MCVGGSIGIWVAGFGSASPTPPSSCGRECSLSLPLSSLLPRAIIPPLEDATRCAISAADLRREFHFASFSLLRRARAQSSINLGKQSRLAGVSSGAQIIGSLPPAVARAHGFIFFPFLTISFHCFSSFILFLFVLANAA